MRTHRGEWQQDYLEEGIFQRGDAYVVLTLANDELKLFDENELSEAALQLGALPSTALGLAILGDENSMALAQEVAGQLVSEWNGIMDWDGLLPDPTGIENR